MRIKCPNNPFHFIFIFASLLLTPYLHADGWERIESVATFEDVAWDEVRGDFNGLNFTALIPGFKSEYSSEVGEDDYGIETSVHGKVESEESEDGYRYYIDTYLSSNTIPKEETFLKVLQFLKPEYTLESVEPQKYGAEFVAHITPLSSDHIYSCSYFHKRYLCTKDRLIILMTDDENSNRRENFFESIKIN
jgi:hypothetical protein